jgi:hypothetical protein
LDGFLDFFLDDLGASISTTRFPPGSGSPTAFLFPVDDLPVIPDLVVENCKLGFCDLLLEVDVSLGFLVAFCGDASAAGLTDVVDALAGSCSGGRPLPNDF